MACLRYVSFGALATSLAMLGCAAGSEPTVGGPTGSDPDAEAPSEDAATTEPDAEPTEDTAPPEDTSKPLEYPPGPYGKSVGAVIPNLTWEGYRDGTGEWTKISLLDYYDPDGKRGVHAIKIGGAALW